MHYGNYFVYNFNKVHVYCKICEYIIYKYIIITTEQESYNNFDIFKCQLINKNNAKFYLKIQKHLKLLLNLFTRCYYIIYHYLKIERYLYKYKFIFVLLKKYLLNVNKLYSYEIILLNVYYNLNFNILR